MPTPLLMFALVAAPIGTDYNRDVRPILAQHCFPCHGPDAAARQAELRLDDFESATAPRYGGAAVVPRELDASAMVNRIRSEDPDEAMPPPDFKKPLTAGQIETLERWIGEGARYDAHWSFQPLPREVAVPAVGDDSWPTNELDRFVLARLEAEGLRPSPDAHPATLLRRVAIDLTGIPPTPEETRAFLADPSPAAYEREVDRLLASPRYGERLAQLWLDLARYADSYGYQSDQLSTFWPWRDFVVDAFRDNLPYDEFVTWQIAGDLLEHPTRTQRLATAFHRLHRLTNEGGTIHEEFRVEGVADRVNTFGAAFLGITTECARCHDHKFDPLPMREYYSLFAQFQNIEEEGTYLWSHLTPTPSVLLPDEDRAHALADAREAVEAARAALSRAREEAAPAFRIWLATPDADRSPPERVVDVDFERVENGIAIGAAGAIDLHGLSLVDGERGRAVRLDGETAPTFDPALLDPALGEAHVPFTIAFSLELPERYGDESRVIVQRSGGTDVGYHGFDLILDAGRPLARIFRWWPGNAIAIRGVERLPSGRRFHLACGYDGSGTASGFSLFVDGAPVTCEIVHDRLWKSTEAGGAFSIGVAFGARFRDRGLPDAILDDVVAFRRALAPLEIARLVDHTAPSRALAARDDHESELRTWFETAFSDPVKAAAATLRARVAERVATENPILEVAVMEESAPRPAHVLARGAYDAPELASTVEPATIAALGLREAFVPRNRLGLARWLTHPDHPLTSRVFVNRLFAHVFGRGLVPTLEDFGAQGAMPSHPELLDWLARDFVAHGFDVKRTMRMLVTSRTYRQASSRTESSGRDPENVRLSRGPAKRLDAETLRDAALFAAGLLDETRGGPPVSPYQPANHWTESNSMSPAYRQSTGKDLWRRSLYTVRKRTAPMPNLSLFDSPSREACTPRRLQTNTPLQALVVWNDVQFVEAARVLAARVAKEVVDDAGRIAAMHWRLAGREIDAHDARVLLDLLVDQRRRFSATPEGAGELIAIGESPTDPSLDPIEHAALTVVAQAILASDAFLTAR